MQIMPFYSTKFEKKEKFLIFFTEELSFIYFIYYDDEFTISYIDAINNEDDLLASTLLVKQQLPFIFSIYSDSNNNTVKLTILDFFNNDTILVKSLDLPNEPMLNIDMASYLENDEFKIIIVYSKNVMPQNASGLFAIIIEMSESFEINTTIISEYPFDFGDYPSVKLVQLALGNLMILEVCFSFNHTYYDLIKNFRSILMVYVNAG